MNYIRSELWGFVRLFDFSAVPGHTTTFGIVSIRKNLKTKEGGRAVICHLSEEHFLH